jgi:hypothetical protein
VASAVDLADAEYSIDGIGSDELGDNVGVTPRVRSISFQEIDVVVCILGQNAATGLILAVGLLGIARAGEREQRGGDEEEVLHRRGPVEVELPTKIRTVLNIQSRMRIRRISIMAFLLAVRN